MLTPFHLEKCLSSMEFSSIEARRCSRSRMCQGTNTKTMAHTSLFV